MFGAVFVQKSKQYMQHDYLSQDSQPCFSANNATGQIILTLAAPPAKPYVKNQQWKLHPEVTGKPLASTGEAKALVDDNSHLQMADDKLNSWR